jgi:lysophospholipase L1-like esterase
MEKLFTYLALGDSYTIGEGVLLNKAFPYQLVQILRKKGLSFFAPEIIAKTGWTTDELRNNIDEYQFLAQYRFVTLLIGVNNQYRGRPVEEYKLEFEALLKQALLFANNAKERVIVLSIPDYSVTPFTDSMNKEKISEEINLFNSVNKAVSIQYKVHYIDITTGFKQALNDHSLIAQDNLHPSEKEYKNWAEKVADIIYRQLK